MAPAPFANPIGDLVAAFFRRIQSVFDPYRTNQNAPTTVDPATGTVTGSAQFTSPFFLPQWYTITAPAGGTASIDKNGQFTYTPTAAARHAASATGASSTDSFTVTANNWISKSSVVVTVPVRPQNNAPVAGATTVGTPGTNGVVAGSVSVTDADADTIGYFVSAPAKGSVAVLSSGAFTYTPTATARHDASATNAPSSATSDGFTITASDGHGGRTPITVVVPILPANQAPVAGTMTIGIPGTNGVVTGTVSATDADTDTVTYTAATGSGAPTHGAVVVTSGGGFTYTPGVIGHGGPTTDTFGVVASDGHGGSTQITVVVPLTPPNLAPVAGFNTVGTPGTDGSVTGTVSATDPDGDVVTFTGPVGGLTTRGQVVTVTGSGEFRYTPTAAEQHDAASYKGDGVTDTFTITASDGRGGSTPITVHVPINPVNVAPVAGTPRATVLSAETGKVTGSINAFDADGDFLTYYAPANSTTSAGGSITVRYDGTYSYIPTAASRHAAAVPGGVSLDSFIVSVSDGHGGTTDVTVPLPIYSANQAPTGGAFTADPAGADGVVTGRVTFTDPDGDGLTYTAFPTMRGGTVTMSPDGSFIYTPAATAAHDAAAGGPNFDAFGVTASDGHGGTTVPVTVVVPITPQNQAPTAAAGTYGYAIVTIDPTTNVITGAITATDADSDALTYTASTPGKGAVTVNPDGTFTYTPTAAARHAASAQDATGPVYQDTFAVTVSDGHGGSKVIPLTVPITPFNSAPVGGTAVLGTPDAKTGAVTGTLGAADADGDTLTWFQNANPANGSVTINADGTFTYTPTDAARAAAATGGPTTDTIGAVASDGHGSYVPVTATVPITSPANRTGTTAV